MNPYYPNQCPPATNPAMLKTKRFSRQKNWDRPDRTETDVINENKEKIQEKLENYTEVDNIDFVSTNTHVRYYVFDTRVNDYRFRLGGLLVMKHTEYVVLSNGSLTWSVPKKTEHLNNIHPTRFFRVLTPYEMQQKKAEQNRQDSDEKKIIVEQQLSELEKQKIEIEKLKRVIVKLSNKEQLNTDNHTIISSASRKNGGSKNIK